MTKPNLALDDLDPYDLCFLSLPLQIEIDYYITPTLHRKYLRIDL